HSLGEYVAATVAGVFTPRGALELVAARARMIEALPAGAMLAVPLPPEAIEPLLDGGAALAAVNAPELCTVSGSPAAVAALERVLAARGVTTRRLRASHAFHSAAMEPVAARLAEHVRTMERRSPSIPFISNVTGGWITAEQAADPEYWASHLTRTVRFADGVRLALRTPGRVFLEVGPGRTLGTFARHAGAPEASVLASLRHAYTRRPDAEFFHETLGRLRAGEVPRHAAHVAPRTATERAVAALWRELLGGAEVGAADDFFERGGHSLLATRLLTRLRSELGVDLTPRDFFAVPTVAGLAARVDEARAAGTRADLAPIPPAPRHGPLPLSFAQQRLWFLETLGAGGAYNVPRQLRLCGALDGVALERALDRIVARHEALRTTFYEVDGAPRQRIAAESRFRLAVQDLRGHPRADEELRRLVAEEADAPFDLRGGPPVRARLARLADDDHVLLVTMHHIVSDGWSLEVLADELAALYAGFASGAGDTLAPLPAQYPDYAAWQRSRARGEAMEGQAAYWEAALAGAPDVIQLPLDHARPARRDFAGSFVEVELDAELTAALKSLGRRHGTTPFVTLLCGWAATLGRLSGQDDVVVGTPVANRGRAEIEGLIGFFVNTLALRVDLAGTPTVAELLARVRERSQEAQQHQDIPFEQVVERVRPTRGMAHTPLFQVMFAWESAPRAVELPGLAPAVLERSPQATAKFDLSLLLREVDGRIAGRVEYATALFERATVERYVGYLLRVLEGMVAADGVPLDRLELLPEAERGRMVDEWNDTAVEYPREACVHELFEARVRRAPDAVAIVSGDQRLTYAELNRRANRLAHHLRERGVGVGGRATVLLPRGTQLIITELATLKAGAAYVPIDPSYPAERIAFMVADSESRVVLSRSGDPVPELPGVERIDVDAVPDGDGSDLPTRPGSESLAYVMYTSGSTGTPKGVMIPHRAITQLMLTNGYAELGPDDRVAFASNPAFDASTMEVWGPLLTGGRIVVVSQEVFLDPHAFGALLRTEGVTTLLITPVLFNPYTEVIATELSELRRILTSGDRADPAAYERVLRKGGPVTVYNCFGPTETTTFCVAHAVERVTDVTKRVPVGRPNGNARAYILDARGEPVPTGVTGEIYIGGEGVALGYLNRPALTAERFVADPFSDKPGARLYRTGDLARWLVEGRIEFVGRADAQVKVRGFRIELGEIETRLREHEGVREAVVVVREEAPGDRRLVAYCVGAVALDAGTLRAHLSQHLPEYMVPAAYVWLERMPLTTNGKLDRRALPAPEADAYGVREYEAPLGEAEEALAAIWAEVLGVERVGRRDNFFDLGGHSLLAAQVTSRVRHALGVEVAPGALFEGPALAEFARGVRAAARARLPPI
ncbi:MAG TPA: amino acid adenylation domain-containing protein, partial [Longimicrobium sp.]|nr:amino acid adenylation domain-containing protein [Longimicrobium sp.]